MKYAVIAGGASGLAQASIKELVKRDYVVFSLDIAHKEIKVEGNIHYVPLDVLSDESFADAKKYVASVTNKVDLLSCFAGIVTLGSLVELPTNTLDKIVGVNLLGTYKLNATFFEMVKNAGGRIINISSEYAKICGLPFHGYYTITKHALDTYSESLRRELSYVGIKVICIRPGAFKTNMQGGITNQFEKVVLNTKLYREPLEKMSGMMTSELNKAKPAEIFAKTFIKAATSKHPKRVYKVNNSFKMKLLSALPTAVQDWALKKFL
ncbi:MAG: SDR family NAD(P)-dependent oxidoreductase [Clostridia bacterium]|nr:SDR family NAD(P)-dependent oxidoreductase [Clostridia bacterium]